MFKVLDAPGLHIGVGQFYHRYYDRPYQHRYYDYYGGGGNCYYGGCCPPHFTVQDGVCKPYRGF
jgi:hypothetical protein